MQDATEESMGDLSNPMVMKNYYNKLLPWKAMFTWLNQSHGTSSTLLFLYEWRADGKAASRL
jgi:hypothetical protein